MEKDERELRDQSDHDLLVELNIRVGAFHEMLSEKVNRSEFVPVRAFVYGLASIVFTSFVVAICKMIYQSK